MRYLDLLDRFDNPPRAFGPVPLWWWSGDEVTDERIRWQLERFDEGGVHNLVVINLAPKGPLYGNDTDRPAWFSEEWWARFGYTCEVAAELNMRIWFYDQLGFSGANISGTLTREHPWAAGQRLTANSLDSLVLETVTPQNLLGAFDRAGHRYAFDDLQDAKSSRADITVVTVRPSSFDYLNPRAADLLLDAVHREFERRLPHHIGKVIAGSFQDELPPINSWTSQFPEQFAARHGYDLVEHLPALFTPGDQRAAKVRADYYAVRTALAEESFFKPLARWHDERGMLLGCDQTSPARAGLPTQSTQLYCDYFRTHRWYSAAGSDHMGDAKVHSSMAHLYGHDRVWMESFHSSGWGGTLEETYDWLIPFVRSGADLYNPHASYFGTFGGWFEWAPPSTDWRQPYWLHYRHFAKAVARLCSVATWGDYVANIAVLHPTTVTQALVTLDVPTQTLTDGVLGAPFESVDLTQSVYRQLCGVGNWFNPEPGALDAAGISFDIIDDHSLQHALAVGQSLGVRAQRYSAIILPSAIVLEDGTARVLLDHLNRGGHVIAVGELPQFAAGVNGDDAVVRALANHARLIHVADAAAAAETVRHLDLGPRSDVPLLVRSSGDEFVALVTGAWPSASKHLGREHRRVRKEFDRSRYATSRMLRITGRVASVEMWNPATGERVPLSAAFDGSESSVEVPLNGAPAVFLIWAAVQDDGAQAPDDADRIGARTPTPVSRHKELTEWTGELVPTLDNRWGDFARPPEAPVTQLQLWSLDCAETTGARPGEWRPAKVTFGQRVRVLGPVPVDDAPAPLTPDQASAIVADGAEIAGEPWSTIEYSSSRGREREGGVLGSKVFVREEFVSIPRTTSGEVAQVRAAIAGADPGAADLIVGAAAAKRVWWNGEEVTTSDGYVSVTRVHVRNGINILEYRLADSENSLNSLNLEPGCFFALASPGEFAAPPVFMSTESAVLGHTVVTYRRSFDARQRPTVARLIVGSHATAAVALDGKTIGVQAKSEQYEDIFGIRPNFFEYDVTDAITAGQHTLQVEVAAFPSAEFVWVDLALRYGDRVETIASGPGWSVTVNSEVGTPRLLRGHWGETAPARAARRTHPLPGASFLRGPAEVGGTVQDIRVDDRSAPTTNWYRVTLPAGTREVTLPLLVQAEVDVAGLPFARVGDRIMLDPPLARPTQLIVRTVPVAFGRGGAAWSGPLLVNVDPAPIQLGDWRAIGLSSWSGGVLYRTIVDPAPFDNELELDLGSVRGTAEVAIERETIGTAFCAPFRFKLGRRGNPFELSVTVYNTLGPFLHESTPTLWVLNGQLVSGLFGPVTIREAGHTGSAA